MGDRIDKIKKHFQDHEEAYVYSALTAVAVTVVAVVVVATKYEKKHPTTIVVNEGNTFGSQNNIQTVEKFFHTVSRYGNKIGRPGLAVYRIGSDIPYASIMQAAEDAGVSYRTMYNHLKGKGKTLDINGEIYRLAS